MTDKICLRCGAEVAETNQECCKKDPRSAGRCNGSLGYVMKPAKKFKAKPKTKVTK